MQVDFYHLTLTPLQRALPRIAEKIIGSGERLLVVAQSEDQIATIDRDLWTYDAESFLPHGKLGDGFDESQPILIARDVNAANGARNVAFADGIWRDEAFDFDRAFHFFDEDTIRAARAAWKGLGEQETVRRRYWKRNAAGRWEQAH